jgi:cytochrome P450
MTTPATARCPFSEASGTEISPSGALSSPADSVNLSRAGSVPEATDYASATAAPAAEWFDPVEAAADPYSAYERLRREAPVAWVPAVRKFLITTFDLCHEVEQDQGLFSANVAGSTMNRALGAQPMLRKDDPEHAADRTAVNPVMRPRNLNDVWAPVFERNARTYLDRLDDVGPEEADLNRDYAAPVAAQNLVDLLGLPEVEVEQMRRWSHNFIAGIGNVLDDPQIWARCDDSQTEIDALLDELLPFYQRHPNTSMTSALANSGLALPAVASNVKLTISGGMNEPQHMITNMVYSLDRNPGQRSQVLADPDLFPAVFDETVRHLSPIGMYPRETTRDTTLGDVKLPAGSALGLVVGSANRDEEKFGEDAHLFRIDRPKQAHLGFGAGVHLCAGHWAAKISIGKIAVPLLYERFPDLRLDERRPEAWNGWVFRGLTSLPVTWN